MADTITQYDMGAAVPEWLLVAEPAVAGAPRGHFRFGRDVYVIDLPTHYAVLPAVSGPGQFLDTTGTEHHNVFASGKPVVFATMTTPIFGHEVQGLVFAQQVDEHNRRLAQPVADPHPSFWQRLKFVLLGR